MSSWFVVRTRPRWEKRVNLLLTEKGIETFCPLLKVKNQWSDRVRIIEKPLLKSYVFVKINDSQLTDVRLTEGVINFVYRNGKLVIVKEKSIKGIKNVQQSYKQIGVIEDSLSVDQAGQPSRSEEPGSNVVLFIDGLNVRLFASEGYHQSTAATDKNHS
jgi:transcription antitermination factor NusG